MTEEKTEKLSLASKLSRIAKEIGVIKKTGRNSGSGGYTFIEYSEVAGRIREKLDEYHVIVIPSVMDYAMDEIQSSGGKSGFHYVLRMQFTIIDGDNPERQMVFPWLGEAADYGDKGVNKAETSAVKYFLMRLFNISDKGEEEADKTTPEVNRITRIPVGRIIKKLITLNTEAEVDAAVEKINEAYPLMLALDRHQIDDAVARQRAKIREDAGEELTTDEDVENL